MSEERATPAPELSFGRWTLQVSALASLTVARPLLEVLARGEGFLTAHGAGWGEVLLFLLLLLGCVPAALAGLAWLAGGLGERAGRVARACVVGGLCLPLASLLLQGAGLPGAAQAVLALGLAAGAGVLFDRRPVVGTWLGALAPALLIVPGLFLFAQPVQQSLSTPAQSFVQLDIEPERSLVLVVLDSVSTPSLQDAAGGLDVSRLPGFAALAEGSRWYRDATTVHDYTTQAVPALLTGRRPDPGAGDQAPSLAVHPQNLFTLLGGSWPLVVYEPATALCPRQANRAGTGSLGTLLSDSALVYAHVTLPPAFAQTLPAVDQTWGNFVGPSSAEADPRLGRFEAFLDDLGPGPAVHVLHLELPHVPYELLPSGRRYQSLDDDDLPGLRVDARWGTWGDDAWAVQQAEQRYLLQLACVDGLVGRLVERLKATGLWDEAVIAVTADHGVSFRPGDNRRILTRTNAAEILSVPCFLRAPGIEPGVDDRNLETIDLVPTLAEALGVTVPWLLDGRSLLAEEAAPRQTKQAVNRAPTPEDPSRVLTFRDLSQGRHQAVARRLATFGADPFQLGEARELLGRPLGELKLLTGGAGVSLTDPGRYQAVDPDAPVLPALIEGWLAVDAPPELELAVAVNGVVRALTQPYQGRGGRFAALVPQDAWAAGANAVEVFEVRGAATLARCEGAYRLEGQVLVSDATRWPLSGGGLLGWLERIERGPRKAILAGWAATADGEPVERLLVFQGEELVATGITGVSRPDVAARFGRQDAGQAGFRLEVAPALLDGPLQVIAQAGSVASRVEPAHAGVERLDRILSSGERDELLTGRCFEEYGSSLLTLDPSQGFAALKAAQQATLELTGGGVRVLAQGSDPALVLTTGELPPRSLILQVEISSPAASTVQVYYRQRGQAPRPEQTSWRHVPAGRSTVHLTIPIADAVSPIRLDPGDAPGTYTIHRIELRAFGG